MTTTWPPTQVSQTQKSRFLQEDHLDDSDLLAPPKVFNAQSRPHVVINFIDDKIDKPIYDEHLKKSDPIDIITSLKKLRDKGYSRVYFTAGKGTEGRTHISPALGRIAVQLGPENSLVNVLRSVAAEARPRLLIQCQNHAILDAYGEAEKKYDGFDELHSSFKTMASSGYTRLKIAGSASGTHADLDPQTGTISLKLSADKDPEYFKNVMEGIARKAQGRPARRDDSFARNSSSRTPHTTSARANPPLGRAASMAILHKRKSQQAKDLFQNISQGDPLLGQQYVLHIIKQTGLQNHLVNKLESDIRRANKPFFEKSTLADLDKKGLGDVARCMLHMLDAPDEYWQGPRAYLLAQGYAALKGVDPRTQAGQDIREKLLNPIKKEFFPKNVQTLTRQGQGRGVVGAGQR